MCPSVSQLAQVSGTMLSMNAGSHVPAHTPHSVPNCALHPPMPEQDPYTLYQGTYCQALEEQYMRAH